MALTAPLVVAPYNRRYQREVLHLIDDHYRVHLHLDWLVVDQWLDEPDSLIWLAWHEHKLVGALAASPPLNGSSWLRLAAVHDDFDAGVVLGALQPLLMAKLSELGAHELALLVQRSWLVDQTALFGMTLYEQITTLQRCGNNWPESGQGQLLVRSGELYELDQALEVDHEAFTPIWQLSHASLREAIRQSTSFMLAFINDQPVGYLVASLYATSAHLSRLATRPEWQGHGVGGALIGEMCSRFARRGVSCISVNTQRSNQKSQRLYQRFGFTFSGIDLPVWRTTF